MADHRELLEASSGSRRTERRALFRRHARMWRSLRGKIALAFVAAVVITALALALSAYYITKTTQDADAVDKAVGQSRFNLFLADSLLPAVPQEADYDNLLQALQIRGDFSTLVEAGSATYVSGPQVDKGLITSELEAKVASGRIGYQTVRWGEEPAIAVGGQVRSGKLTLYFFFPQGDRLAELSRLRNILAGGSIVLAVLGAIAGYLLARRLLEPVRVASGAAEQMSLGDLDIRLPVGGDEFGTLAASFNRMAGNLQAKMLDLETGQARERRFVADVAHELRTPVSALVGEASLLKARLDISRESCSPDVSRLAALVSGDIARLRQLVDDLLEIGRLDAQAADLVLEWIDLETFLSQLVKAHGWSEEISIVDRAKREGVPAAEDTGQGVARYRLHTDKRRVERIFVNLLENALRHGATPVAIEISRSAQQTPTGLAGSDEYIRVTVTDSGSGIADEHLPHVFDRFYKADPSRSSGPGSGLGLAIARENARLLRGDLEVSNVPGNGARFLLTLPAGKVDLASTSSADDTDPPGPW